MLLPNEPWRLFICGQSAPPAEHDLELGAAAVVVFLSGITVGRYRHVPAIPSRG
jgi:hypothetical protein